jgi:hypothetical protein
MSKQKYASHCLAGYGNRGGKPGNFMQSHKLRTKKCIKLGDTLAMCPPILSVIFMPAFLQVVLVIPFVRDHLAVINLKDPVHQ